MDLKSKVLKQLEGKTVNESCSNCGKEASIVIGKNGSGKCNHCDADVKINVNKVIEGFKEMEKKLGVKIL